MPLQENTMNKVDINQLKTIAKQVRRDIVMMTHASASGHPGGSLSATELGVALYFAIMKHDPKNAKWADRDRMILSKGHATPMLYSVLAQAGYFETNLLPTFRKLGSPLQGHPDRRRLPGIEASTGSLGQGLSIALGHELARKLDKKDYYSYVVMSDGECNEGQVWEAAAMAAHHKMDHLIVYIDMNKYQLDDCTKTVCDMEPMHEKWKGFNWHVQRIDGHDFTQILKATEIAKAAKNQPAVIVCDTIKGKGISFMENNNHFHGVAPTTDEMERAMKELA